MSRKTRVLITLILFGVLFFSTAQVKADPAILYFEDLTLGTSAVPGALHRLGLSATTASSFADFNAQLNANAWDLVIFGEQGKAQFQSDPQPLTDYVFAGGKLLAATSTDSGISPLGLLLAASSVDDNASTIFTS